MNKLLLVLPISVTFLLIDQISKYLIIDHIPLYGRINVLPFFDIVHYRNTGVAFGFMSGMPEDMRHYFFVAVFLIAFILIFFFIYHTPVKEKMVLIPLSLILSGAIGNSIDRMKYGYVTDFLDFHWFGDPNLHWPPFNVADSCITIGVILLILHSIFLNKDKEQI